MCGIAGIHYRNSRVPDNMPHAQVLRALEHRGPDFQAYKLYEHTALYHSRLEIVDTTEASNQPYSDGNGDTTMVFNGEIFNYKDFYSQLPQLATSGDVEVLYRLIDQKGKNCLNALNGFFAFAFYNRRDNSLLLARDRFGVKPLYYYYDEKILAFASEIKPLLVLTGKQEINPDQLYTYFRLNYCSGPATIFKNIQRLQPGQYLELKNNAIHTGTWYKAQKHKPSNSLETLLDDAVKIRLQADVPVGTFLSGGIDSSIISALAKRHKPSLETFSIGFEKENYFDETAYAELVAKRINSRHHVFKLKEDDFLHNIHHFLNSIDEPFADSSAFNFYLLSKYTKQHVKVALSGDGADELFKGYNKHRALLLARSPHNRLFAKLASGLLSAGKSSRDGVLKNRLRQLKKFSDLAPLNGVEQQKFLASISQHNDCEKLLKKNPENYFNSLFKLSESYTNFELDNTFDIQTVLADDMLVKADRFSMQHGIEIRNPFLDYRVVEYALNLAESEKIGSRGQKLILRKAFAPLLPEDIFTRSKKGFELPLQKWLSNHLKSKVENEWLNRDKIEAEGLLNYNRVQEIKTQAFSADPGDSAAKLWAIIVFEAWMDNIHSLA
jgi:asparagine synthase (glutamine-hydrolysing)